MSEKYRFDLGGVIAEFRLLIATIILVVPAILFMMRKVHTQKINRKFSINKT